MELVLAAGRNYVPTDPSATSVGTNEDDDDEGTSNERPAMAYLLDDITSSPWYNDQIVYRHTVSSKEAVLGE